MYIATSSLPKVAEEFVSSVLMPRAPTPVMKFGLGFLLPYVAGAAEETIAQALPAMKALGVVNDLGKVDLEKARSAAYAALEKAGDHVTVYGYTADKSDIDALFGFAQKYAVNE